MRRGSGPCLGLADPPSPRPGVLQALEAVNTQLRELYPDSEELFDIVLMTNNHAQVGVRLINSINHYGELRAELSLVRELAALGQSVIARQPHQETLSPVSSSKPLAEPSSPQFPGLELGLADGEDAVAAGRAVEWQDQN